MCLHWSIYLQSVSKINVSRRSKVLSQSLLGLVSVFIENVKIIIKVSGIRLKRQEICMQTILILYGLVLALWRYNSHSFKKRVFQKKTFGLHLGLFLYGTTDWESWIIFHDASRKRCFCKGLQYSQIFLAVFSKFKSYVLYFSIFFNLYISLFIIFRWISLLLSSFVIKS